MSPAPRRLLLNDEGSAALYHLHLDRPDRCWSFNGPGRDLQLIGNDLVLRSTPTGFVELHLEDGEPVREVTGLTGIESAQRLPSGHTVVLGNGDDGIYLQELDARGEPLAHARVDCRGASKGRLLRRTGEDTWLFCSDTEGRRVVHEASLSGGAHELFRVPSDVAADSMVKALRVAPNRIVVSSGYAASLLIVDTARQAVVETIGGKQEVPQRLLRRRLSPHFFSGFQLLGSGHYLIANWQGHGPSHGSEGYQVLSYTASGELAWAFDQTEYPHMASLNNVIALDGLDTLRLHDERNGVLAPV